jgi:tetratricopeptide (TPR) repeat protein
MAIARDELLTRLAADPGDSSVLEQWERHCTASSSWDDLLGTLPAAAGLLSDAVARTRFWIRAMAVAVAQRQDALAHELVQSVVALDLPEEGLTLALSQAFLPDADWPGCLDAIGRFLTALPESATGHRSRLLLLQGQVLEDRLHDKERAITAYQKAFKAHPLYPEPLRAARRIYLEAEQWKTALKLYDYELRIPQDDRAKARVFREMGQILLDRLQEQDRAIEAFEQAIMLDADLKAGLGALVARLRGEPETPVDVDAQPLDAEVIDAGAEPVEPETEAPLVEVEPEPVVHDVMEGPAGEAEPAGLDGGLPEDDPTAPVATEEDGPVAVEPDAIGHGEEAPAGQQEDQGAAPVAAEPAAADISSPGDGEAEAGEPPRADSSASASDAEASVTTMETGMAASPEAEDEGNAGAEAEVSIRAHDAGEAAPAPVAARAVAPASPGASRPVVQTSGPAAGGGALPVTWPPGLEDWIQSLVEEASGDEGVLDVAVALELGRKMGLGPEVLTRWALRGVACSSDGLRATQALFAGLYGAVDVWQGLAEELEVLAEDDAVAASALYGVRFYGLADPEGASRWASAAGAVGQREQDALELAGKGNWRKVQQGLQDALSGTWGANAEAESYRAQAWVAFGMGLEDKAVDSLRRVVRSLKTDVPASSLLRAVFVRAGKWNELAGALKSELAMLGDAAPQRRSAMLREMLWLYRDELRQDPLVVSTYQSILELDPTDLGIIEPLCAKLEEMNRFPDLVEALKRKAAATDDVSSRMEILERVAGLYQEKFNNQAEAIRVWEEVLSLDPESSRALAALEDGYEKRRDWDSLIAIRLRMVEASLDGLQKARLLRDCADVATTRKRDLPQAIGLWEQVLEVVPGDSAALAALEQIYERDKQWESLAEVLQQRVNVLDDAKERAAALLKLGQVAGDRLGRTEQALEAWEQLLGLEPDNFRARDAVRKGYVDLGRWDALETFYARDGQWAEYVRQLESLAGTVEGDGLRIELLERAARVWDDQLGDESRAVKNLERILSLQPDHATAAARLAPVYRERGDHKRLQPVLEILLAHESAPEARSALMVELGRLYRERFRDAEQAFSWLGQALQETPWDGSLAEEVEQSASACGDWAGLETLLRDAAAALEGDGERSAAWRAVTLQLGRVLAGELSLPDDALRCYDAVLAREPENVVALDAKDQIFTREARWDDLLDVVVAKLDRATDLDERILLLQRISVIHEDSREDVDSAIGTWCEILSLSPQHRDALEALTRLYRQTERHDALGDILRLQLDLHPWEREPQKWLVLSMELAQVLVDPMALYDQALDIVAEVLRRAPEHGTSRQLLSSLVEEETVRPRAAGMLAPLHEADGAWGPLVSVLEILLEETVEPAGQVALLHRIADVHADRRQDDEAALEALARLLRVAPADAAARARYEALTEATGGWEALATLWEELAEDLAHTAVEEAVGYLESAALVRDEPLGEIEESIRLHNRILELVPQRAESLAALDGLYRRAERWDDLLRNCQDRLGRTEEPAARRAIHLQAALIHESLLDDPASAIVEYLEVLALQPDDAESLESLDRLYTVTEDASALCGVLARRAALEAPGTPARLSLLDRQAQVTEEALQDAAGTLALCRSILEEDAGHPGARQRLRGLLSQPEWALQVVGILEPIHEAHQEYPALAELLEVVLEHASDPLERRGHFARLLELQRSSLGDASSAWGTVERALAEFLQDDLFLGAADELAAELGCWEALADLLESLADEAMDPQVVRDTLVRCARIRDGRLGDAPSAVGLWERVLDGAPQDAEALDALEQLHQRLAQWGPLVEVLLQKADIPASLGDPAVRRGLLFRAAQLQETSLGDPERAIEVLQQVLAFEPDNLEAVEQLERLYARTESWEDLVENYHRKLRLMPDVADQRNLWWTMGRVLESELEDADRAIAAYRAMLDLAPTDLDAWRALDRLYTRTEAWSDLLSTLQRLAELVDEPDQRHALWNRCAHLQVQELMNPAAAVDTWEQVLTADPSDADARGSLLELLRQGEEASRAFGLLEPIFRSEGQWEALVEMDRLAVEHTDDPSRRHELWVDVARLLEDQLGDVSGAFAAWVQAIREWTVAADLVEAQRLAEVCGEVSEVVTLFAERWDEVSEPALRTDLGLRVARLRASVLGDDDGAVEAYTRVVDESPGQLEALDALDRLYHAAGAWGPLADVLVRRVEMDAGPASIPFRLRLASLHRDALDAPSDAVMAWREVLMLDPGCEEALSGLLRLVVDGVETTDAAGVLEPIFRGSGAWKRLAELYQARLAHEDVPEEQYRLWLELAEVQQHSLQDSAAALFSVGSALLAVPGDEGLKSRVEQLAEETGRWDLAAETWEALLESDLDDMSRFDAAQRLATVRRDQLADAAGAEAAFRVALDVEPGSESVLRSLDALVSAREDWVALSTLLGQLREVVFEPAELLALTLRHAALLETQLEDMPGAIGCLRDAVDVDPTSRPALVGLVRLYAAAGAWESLFEALERQAEQQSDLQEQAATLEQMAELAVERLDRVDDAIDLWRRVLDNRGGQDAGALEQLAALYRQTEQAQELVLVLDRLVELAADDIARARLLQESGYTWAEVLDNQEEAILRYERLLVLVPEEASALGALRVLYERVGRWDALARTLQTMLSLGAIDTAEQGGVYRQLGELYTDVLLQPDDAIAAWQAVLQVVPGDEGALDRLDTLYTDHRRWEPLVGVLEQRLQVLEDDADRIEVLKRIAVLWLQELEQPERAADAYNRVLDIDLLEFDAGQAFEQLITRLERWDDLAALHLDRADALGDAWERRTQLLAAAAVYEHRLGQPGNAFVVLQKAAVEAPLDEELHAELERLAALASQYAELAAFYRDNLLPRVREDASADAAAALPLLLAVGRLQDEALGRPDAAEPWFVQALEVDGENEPALLALESIYTRTEEWESLVDILRRRAAIHFDQAEQARYYLRVGALQETQLDDLAEATESYRMVVRLDDQNAEALAALERIYTSQSQWRQLVEVLDLQAQATFEPAALTDLRYRIAALWHRQLDQPERAVDAYGDVLAVTPDHMQSLVALEELHARLEKWDRYVDVVEQRLMLTQDTWGRKELLFKLAQVWEVAFDDIDRAVDALRQVLSLDAGDLQAIETLERIFSEQERYTDLVDVYEQHVQALADNPQAQTAVLAAMGRTWTEALEDVYRGVETYQRILAVDPDHLVALERLAALYEESLADAPNAIAMLERLAQASPVQEARGRALFRSGELHEVELQDIPSAMARYQAVLQMDEAHIPSMQALQRVYMTLGQWVDAVEMIERQIEHNRDLGERSVLLVSIGAINEHHMGNLPGAQRRYEEALELDPANVWAAEPLSRMYFEEQKWERARSGLELLVSSDAWDKDDAILADLYTRLGRCNEELTFDDEAQKWYDRTRRLSTRLPEPMLGLARIMRRQGRAAEAYALNVEILTGFRSALDADMLVELYYQCAELKAEMGAWDEAVSLYQQVLEIDARHEPSLRRLVAALEQTDDAARLAEARQALFEAVHEPTEKLTLITQVGDAWLAAGDATRAERAFRQAVALDPESRLVLNKLLQTYIKSEKWERACEVLGQLARTESDDHRRARYLYTIGTIFRDQLNNPSQALEFFNQALDEDPLFADPFAAVDQLTTEARDWNTQQQQYRKMIARVAPLSGEVAEELLFVLLRSLGVIYRDRLNQLDKAAEAFKAAMARRPEDEKLQQALAELYDRFQAPPEDIIELHRQMLVTNPTRIDSYHAIFRAYLTRKEFDRAWCVVSVLALFQKQSSEEDAYYKRYLTPHVQQASRALSDEHWGLLVHPQVDPVISRIFAIIANGIRDQYAGDYKRWNVHKRNDRIDLTQAMPLTQMLRYGFERLGVPPLALYATRDYPDLHNGNFDPPGLVAGPNVVKERTDRELAFVCSRAITLCRPEFYLGSAFNSTDALKIFFYAALALQTGQIFGDAPVETVTEYVRALQRLPEPVQVQLRNQVAIFLQEGRNPDLSAWLRGIDHTASRVGLLLCGDVRTAVDCIRNEQIPIGKEDVRERVMALVNFAVSDEFSRLRTELGLALGS